MRLLSRARFQVESRMVERVRDLTAQLGFLKGEVDAQRSLVKKSQLDFEQQSIKHADALAQKDKVHYCCQLEVRT